MESTNGVSIFGLDKPEKKKRYIDDKGFIEELGKFLERVHASLSKRELVIAENILFDLSVGKESVHIIIGGKNFSEFADLGYSDRYFIPELCALRDTDIPNAIDFVKRANEKNAVRKLMSLFTPPCAVELLAAYNELYRNDLFEGYDAKRPLIEENHGSYYIYSEKESVYTDKTNEFTTKMETPVLRVELKGFNPIEFAKKPLSERYNYTVQQFRDNPKFKTISTFYG